MESKKCAKSNNYSEFQHFVCIEICKKVFFKMYFLGTRESTAGSVLALHMANPVG